MHLNSYVACCRLMHWEPWAWLGRSPWMRTTLAHPAESEATQPSVIGDRRSGNGELFCSALSLLCHTWQCTRRSGISGLRRRPKEWFIKARSTVARTLLFFLRHCSPSWIECRRRDGDLHGAGSSPTCLRCWHCSSHSQIRRSEWIPRKEDVWLLPIGFRSVQCLRTRSTWSCCCEADLRMPCSSVPNRSRRMAGPPLQETVV
mmetsp:Transcript_69897/g.163506  ORF Transcript_69897/g.163506 Transcript_69897/m.163506 type:complete len:203 (+) Transcript_69897:408-1016(+)